jgi:hypothetical protein
MLSWRGRHPEVPRACFEATRVMLRCERSEPRSARGASKGGPAMLKEASKTISSRAKKQRYQIITPKIPI